ncbi:hypothetical protein IWZ03DRAFT_184032 [Phyllosticta citriasiana]|uniref:Uncharacterized protein n=1 Tax=Phyllosticta citriasiana TaxID=595635 RepID=A0ABR1KN50_9PEZI
MPCLGFQVHIPGGVAAKACSVVGGRNDAAELKHGRDVGGKACGSCCMTWRCEVGCVGRVHCCPGLWIGGVAEVESGCCSCNCLLALMICYGLLALWISSDDQRQKEQRIKQTLRCYTTKETHDTTTTRSQTALVSRQPSLLGHAPRRLLVPAHRLEAAVDGRDGHVNVELVEDPAAHVADNHVRVVVEVDEQGAHYARRQGARGAGLLVGRGRERVLGAQPSFDAVDGARVAVDDCCDFRDGRVG